MLFWFAVTLAAESGPDAPWMPLLRRDIVNMTRFLKLALTAYRPEATPTEIARSGGTAAPADTNARIAALRAASARDPHDYKASIELARLLAQSGKSDAAAAVLARLDQEAAGMLQTE